MPEKARIPFPPALQTVTRRAWPLMLLGVFLIWAWRSLNFFSSIPAYGDTLEMMWVLSWYGDAIRAGQSISVYPLAFYPGGWYYSENLYMLLGMLPLYWLAGPAFAYNVVVFFTFLAAFVGAFKLAREFVGQQEASIAALLITFWGGRWFHTLGHANILIGSAMVPWILWALNRGLHSAGRRTPWFVLTGLLWALSMTGSMYFAPLVGLAVATWILGCLTTRTITWRTALTALVLPGALALVISAPSIYWLGKSSVQAGVPFYPPIEVNFWGASINNLPLPSLDHPWLGNFARRLYRGVPFEQATINLGLVASLLAIAGAWAALKRKEWRPVLLLTAVTLALTLGLTLKWDNESIHWGLLRPLNQAMWGLGHWLKPSFFVSARPPEPFDTAVPLPGMLVAAIIPFLERARVFARYALVGGVGVFLLTALGLTLVRQRWARLALILLLVIEVVPRPLARLPFPPSPPPAFDWLKQQSIPGQSIADLVAGHPYTPVLLNEGQTVLATRYHGKPTVAGASSIWPADTSFLYEWLATHEHAFWSLDAVPIFRFFAVRYILLHMVGEQEQGILEEAKSNQDLRLVKCFPGVPGPWNYPICVLEVLPPANPNLNLVLGDGWSGAEGWGVWAEGIESQALWVATTKGDYRLQIEAFPICLDAPGRFTSIEVNGVQVGTHEWAGCDPWSAELTVPADVVQLGSNDLVVRSSHAARPSELQPGQSDDTRLLSAGFSKLRIEPASP